MPKLAYHFTADTLRDGSPIPQIGEWLTYTDNIEICCSGLHASFHPLDALEYAPGNYLHLVEVKDIIDQHFDKFVCRSRKIIKTINSQELNKEFARWCALSVIDLWEAPEIVKEYLETGDKTLMADVRVVASTVASTVAMTCGAASSAAGAAGAAVWAADSTSVRDAFWAAAWAADAVRDAVWAAAWAAQRDKYLQLVTEAFKKV